MSIKLGRYVMDTPGNLWRGHKQAPIRVTNKGTPETDEGHGPWITYIIDVSYPGYEPDPLTVWYETFLKLLATGYRHESERPVTLVNERLKALREGLQKLIDQVHSEGHAFVRTADLLELLRSTDNKSEGGEKGVSPPPLPSGGCTGASEPPG